MMTITLENIHELDFDKTGGLIPAIVQDANTRHVLMQGYVNAGALVHTFQEEKVTFWSRSKNRLWTKGEKSGNHLHLVSVRADCDLDSLLITAVPLGPVCHTGDDTCFGKRDDNDMGYGSFLSQLYTLVLDRKRHPIEGSYTNQLFERGLNKIAQKVGEEAVELVIEAKDNNKELFLNESADLLYHMIVLLVEKGYGLDEVEHVLRDRHNSQ